MKRLVDVDEIMRDAESFSAFRHGLADLNELAMLLAGATAFESDPCNFCAYDPPSARDGKPCCYCPAVAKYRGDDCERYEEWKNGNTYN